MSIKKYMLIDLGILSFIGLILEGIGTYFINYMYVGAYPSTIFSILITVVALVRWGWKGLVVIPFCAVGMLIGGQFFVFHETEVYKYGWKELLSVILGLSTISFNLVLFKKYKTNNLLLKYNWFMPVMIIVNCFMFELVRTIVYNWMLSGENIYIRNNAIGYDITGYAISLIMGYILLKQKVMLNFEEKILAERNRQLSDRQIEDDYLKNLKNESRDDSSNDSEK